MFDRGMRLADMPAEQRLLNLNLAMTTPAARRRVNWPLVVVLEAVLLVAILAGVL